MARIFPGRYTAETDQPFVVFLIGMRINALWAVHQWVPTFIAMGPMLTRLFTHPEMGLLGARTYIGWREVMVVQYWRSTEDLERFAREPAQPHWPAWRRFVRHVGYNSARVGIWHETYEVRPDAFETIYGNMPAFGLAAATRHVSVRTQRDTMRQRLATTEPAMVTPASSDAPTSQLPS